MHVDGEPRDAVAKLDALEMDFQYNKRTGPAAPDPELVDHVQDLTPTGNVKRGSTIDLTVYGVFPDPPAPPTPNATPATAEPGQPATSTLSWAPCRNARRFYRIMHGVTRVGTSAGQRSRAVSGSGVTEGQRISACVSGIGSVAATAVSPSAVR